MFSHTLEVFPTGIFRTKWNIRLRHRNGNIIMSSTSQKYSNKDDAIDIAQNVKGTSPHINVKIVDR